jgi:hypothetical protein
MTATAAIDIKRPATTLMAILFASSTLLMMRGVKRQRKRFACADKSGSRFFIKFDSAEIRKLIMSGAIFGPPRHCSNS